MEVAFTEGSGTLRIEARGAFCDVDAENPACRLVEEAWLVPVTLAADGLELLPVE